MEQDTAIYCVQNAPPVSIGWVGDGMFPVWQADEIFMECRCARHNKDEYRATGRKLASWLACRVPPTQFSWVSQVALEVFFNIAHHAWGGKLACDVSVWCQIVADDSVTVSISDSGRGISDSQFEKVRRRFSRRDSADPLCVVVRLNPVQPGTFIRLEFTWKT